MDFQLKPSCIGRRFKTITGCEIQRAGRDFTRSLSLSLSLPPTYRLSHPYSTHLFLHSQPVPTRSNALTRTRTSFSLLFSSSSLLLSFSVFSHLLQSHGCDLLHVIIVFFIHSQLSSLSPPSFNFNLFFFLSPLLSPRVSPIHRILHVLYSKASNFALQSLHNLRIGLQKRCLL